MSPHILFSSLPEEVLLDIFKHLEPITDLCFLSLAFPCLRRLAHSPSLWTHVKIPGPETAYQYRPVYTDENDLASPAKRRRVGNALSRYLGSASKVIEFVTKVAGESLVHLDLTAMTPQGNVRSTQLDGKSMRRLTDIAARSLQHFGCSPSHALTSKDFLTFASSCTELRSLAVRGVSIFSVSLLTQIVEANACLERISVVDCETFRSSAGRLWQAIAPVASILQSIDLSGTNVTSLPFDDFMMSCPLLEEVIADRCKPLCFACKYPAAAAVPGPLCPRLSWIRFDYAMNFPTELLRLCFTRGTPVRALSLNGTSAPANLSAFNVHSLPQLEHLALASQQVTNEFFLEIVIERLGDSLMTLDVSRSLRLTGCNITAHAGFVKKNFLFKRLAKLNLSGTAITEEALKVLIEIAPKLVELTTIGCRSVTDRHTRRNPLETLR